MISGFRENDYGGFGSAKRLRAFHGLIHVVQASIVDFQVLAIKCLHHVFRVTIQLAHSYTQYIAIQNQTKLPTILLFLSDSHPSIYIFPIFPYFTRLLHSVADLQLSAKQ